MNYETVLNQLQNDEISIEKAYGELYKEPKVKPGKRAFFLKINIQVPDEGKNLNTFLRILFALPIPLVFARMGLRIAHRFAPDELQEVDLKVISNLLKYSRNTKIQVDAKDAKVDIKFI